MQKMTDYELIILRALARLEPPVERKTLYRHAFFARKVTSNHISQLERAVLIHMGSRWGPVWLTIRAMDLLERIDNG